MTSPPPINTIVVPAWQEEVGIAVVLKKLLAIIDDSYEIIVVDDGSDDDTAKIASQFPCRVIKHEVNQGKGQALKTGIAQARGQNIIWIDADDSYPVDVIPRMVASLDSYDMVIGSRSFGKQNIPRFNRVGNFIFSQMIQKIYGYKGSDVCTGLCAAKKRDLDIMKLSARRFAIEPEIALKSCRLGLKVLDIPIEYRPRVGNSKLNAIRVGFEDLLTILKHIAWRPKKEV